MNGTQLENAFDKQGNALDYAYNALGTIVYESSSDPYAYDSIESIYNKPRDSAQGMDIYGNYMAIYRDSDHAVQLVNMTTWQIEYTLSTSLTAHGNDITFSHDFYDESDRFPILYINDKLNGLRLDLTNLTTAIVQTIGATPYNNEWIYGLAFDDDMTRLYLMGYTKNDYTDTSGLIYLETWDISESIDNPTRIDRVIRDWFPCIQGLSYHDGLLWVASGMGNPVKVYALSLSDASIVKTINLTRTGELEGIGWGYDNSTNKWFCVYGQIYNGITYYRIDFSSTPIT